MKIEVKVRKENKNKINQYNFKINRTQNNLYLKIIQIYK